LPLHQECNYEIKRSCSFFLNSFFKWTSVKLPNGCQKPIIKNLMASFIGNYKVNIDPLSHFMNSCHVSLDPTRNLAMKNPIVSRGDDGSNLWTSSSSPGRNHSLYRHQDVKPKIGTKFFFMLFTVKKWKVCPPTLLNSITNECVQARVCKGER